MKGYDDALEATVTYRFGPGYECGLCRWRHDAGPQWDSTDWQRCALYMRKLKKIVGVESVHTKRCDRCIEDHGVMVDGKWVVGPKEVTVIDGEESE